MAPAAVLELLEEFQQRIQLTGPQGARPADFLLMPGQFGWQTPLAQQAHRSGTQFPQIKLLGLAMLQVVVPAGTPVAGGQSRRGKAAGPVASAPVLAFRSEERRVGKECRSRWSA